TTCNSGWRFYNAVGFVPLSMDRDPEAARRTYEYLEGRIRRGAVEWGGNRNAQRSLSCLDGNRSGARSGAGRSRASSRNRKKLLTSSTRKEFSSHGITGKSFNPDTGQH